MPGSANPPEALDSRGTSRPPAATPGPRGGGRRRSSVYGWNARSYPTFATTPCATFADSSTRAEAGIVAVLMKVVPRLDILGVLADRRHRPHLEVVAELVPVRELDTKESRVRRELAGVGRVLARYRVLQDINGVIRAKEQEAKRRVGAKVLGDHRLVIVIPRRRGDVGVSRLEHGTEPEVEVRAPSGHKEAEPAANRPLSEHPRVDEVDLRHPVTRPSLGPECRRQSSHRSRGPRARCSCRGRSRSCRGSRSGAPS